MHPRRRTLGGIVGPIGDASHAAGTMRPVQENKTRIVH